MNGYGSHSNATPAALSRIQKMTTIVWPTMYCGVPKKRAACSAPRPKASCPNVPWCSRCAGRCDTRPRLGLRADGSAFVEQGLRHLEIGRVDQDLALAAFAAE